MKELIILPLSKRACGTSAVWHAFAFFSNETMSDANTELSQSLPDMQNRGAAEILGANVPILQVGISNFRLPVMVERVNGDPMPLEVSVTGTVSLAVDSKGINMSRIMRVFYEFEDHVFTPELIEDILIAYKDRLGSARARLKVEFSYPLILGSLRSGLEGWQYYKCAYEGLLDEEGHFDKRIYFDFVYSSACPCSDELAEHARQTRGVHAVPHSQRSVARLIAKVGNDQRLAIEDLQKHCARGLMTETQVMVKRGDEQAFAELNGAQTKFVEDAARLVFAELDGDARIEDFQVAFAHLESLHSHDAVAVINKGIPGGFTAHIDDFKALIR